MSSKRGLKCWAGTCVVVQMQKMMLKTSWGCPEVTSTR